MDNNKPKAAKNRTKNIVDVSSFSFPHVWQIREAANVTLAGFWHKGCRTARTGGKLTMTCLSKFTSTAVSNVSEFTSTAVSNVSEFTSSAVSNVLELISSGVSIFLV